MLQMLGTSDLSKEATVLRETAQELFGGPRVEVLPLPEVQDVGPLGNYLLNRYAWTSDVQGVHAKSDSRV